ncbi:hypothetical protein PM082_001506 [Marasmius tenuissimus]|nr:hypothetical protein PM082_001506 [Marasmius tenuissimus]
MSILLVRLQGQPTHDQHSSVWSFDPTIAFILSRTSKFSVEASSFRDHEWSCLRQLPYHLTLLATAHVAQAFENHETYTLVLARAAKLCYDTNSPNFLATTRT